MIFFVTTVYDHLVIASSFSLLLTVLCLTRPGSCIRARHLRILCTDNTHLHFGCLGVWHHDVCSISGPREIVWNVGPIVRHMRWPLMIWYASHQSIGVSTSQGSQSTTYHVVFVLLLPYVRITTRSMLIAGQFISLIKRRRWKTIGRSS